MTAQAVNSPKLARTLAVLAKVCEVLIVVIKDLDSVVAVVWDEESAPTIVGTADRLSKVSLLTGLWCLKTRKFSSMSHDKTLKQWLNEDWYQIKIFTKLKAFSFKNYIQNWVISNTLFFPFLPMDFRKFPCTSNIWTRWFSVSHTARSPLHSLTATPRGSLNWPLWLPGSPV